jgi:hypothetical protein
MGAVKRIVEAKAYNLGMVISRRAILGAIPVSVLTAASELKSTGVTLMRVPNQGLQPRPALDERGQLHLVYLAGDPRKSDIFYTRSADFGAKFSAPQRVNSQPGSAIAAGTIRGAQIALGKGGRVHVAWNGSAEATPKGPLNPAMPAHNMHNGIPMLYSRLNDAGTAFEPQRNVMTASFALDGGGSVTADQAGNVYVAWHGGNPKGPKGEAGRRVWVARSQDNGRTFQQEAAANTDPTGACACCGLEVFAERSGRLRAFYRGAREVVHRDIYLLTSEDQGNTFHSRLVHEWNIGACPMSSMSFVQRARDVAGAWETQGQVYWTTINGDSVGVIKAAPGTGEKRKHPRLAVNQRGETILVWTEGTGFGKGGSIAWQLYDADGKPMGDRGSAPGLPAFSFASVFARPTGEFVVLY